MAPYFATESEAHKQW